MFLLAEPHFAMTLPLLYGYREKLADPLIFIFYPALIIVSASILFFFYSSIFFIIFLIANVYHVNRQSVGFFKTMSAPLITSKIYEITLHLVTIICIYFALFLKILSIQYAVIFRFVVDDNMYVF